MKLKMLLFAGLFFSGVMLSGFLSRSTQAEELTCIGDYYSFILNVRSEDSRSESIKDVFTLGYCQLNDIRSLDDELDTLRENFRTAASSCNSTSSYKEDYQRILMEMYFVRHLQKGGVLDAVDEKALEALKETKLATLKATMKSVFVDEEGRVEEAAFNSYFESWSAKYDDRIADYRKCEEGPWAELTTTWTDFVDTLKELDFSVDIEKGNSLKEILVPETDLDVDQDMTALGNGIKNAWEYLQSEKEKRKAEIENAATPAELGSTGGSMTFDQALSALDDSASNYDLQSRSEDRMSEYSQLYGAGGSVQATNLQGVVGQLNLLLEEMNTKDLPSIAANSAKVSDKQCK